MDDDEDFVGDLFGTVEEETVLAPEPTTEIYRRSCEHSQPNALTIRLVGSHPLWAHHLWNASKVFARLFDDAPELVRDKYVLELGAGGALPSLMAAVNGAAKVVVTDYPDKELIDNIQYNVNANHMPNTISVQGYVWGTSTCALKNELPKDQTTFDVIILSDLVFNHSQHHAMLRTCRELLTPGTGRVYVFYTHHRPHLAHRDRDFFTIAKRPYTPDLDPNDRENIGYGFEVDHFIQEKMHVMFEDDPGDVEVRSTVHGWQMWIPRP
ncbi:S-adenosyl-L-methionine-dependent methyltransferase [Dichotomocladium elegans]|nr:S-adenosyl-L-methionine-dependent methyltransferase [Dichotomocladium elegans]